MILKTGHELTASTQITTKGGSFGGVLVITDGTNNAVITAYDVDDSGDIAATNKIFEITVLGTEHYGGIIFPHPIKFITGLYITVSGTGASFIPYYTK